MITHENNSRALKRLHFIKFTYLGDSVKEATIKLEVTEKTLHYWQDYWNKGGIDALMLQFSRGRIFKRLFAILYGLKIIT
ncbi:helix-turn-helix domain-containing protein [Methanosarcina flavescens]|uniref:Helix-turn-helix domain-containing protein n=1 Tax=Methanosarcina flavescens TaxID=1715806 RepID=A0A660HUL6_9EURY|nr:helix-turn-helix domain-containing protein [Methanosarcina flavescens]